MKLALGPVLYYWPRDQLLNFYTEVATWPVDYVYLGETVCSKRRSLNVDDWLNIANILAAKGKEVVLSTLSLLEAESELLTLRRICNNGQFLVEANDLGAIQILSSQGLPFVAGPTVNIYNPRTLRLLAQQGLQRWVLPVELSRASLEAMHSQRPAGVATEIIAFGRLPLAFSARCFTARSRNLPKDDCGYCCIDYPEGRLLSTRDDKAFLVLNGIQTLSALPINLLPELADLQQLDIDVLRISPQPEGTAEIVKAFASGLNANTPVSVTELTANVAKFAPLGTCSGYWYNNPGMDKGSS
ncbi:protease [Achromatium sp. WMS2]|nr:protease [Achromatium sp. WMS2]